MFALDFIIGDPFKIPPEPDQNRENGNDRARIQQLERSKPGIQPVKEGGRHEIRCVKQGVKQKIQGCSHRLIFRLLLVLGFFGFMFLLDVVGCLLEIHG